MPTVPRKPRLLIIVTLAEVGGAQTYVARLLPALVDRFDVTVAAHGPGPLRAAAAEAGARFTALRHVRRPVSLWRDLLGLLELIRICRRERPDIVHSNSSKGGLLGSLAALVAGVKIRIFTVHGWAFTWHTGRKGKLYLLCERLTGRLSTLLICVSEKERALGVQARTCTYDRAVVIRNAVDVSGTPQAHHGARIATLVTVGRLKAPKDTLTFLRALARLDHAPFRARIVGDGPERERLEAELRVLELDSAVELLGERNDVSELLSAADVFVLSSRSEGLPLSIVEAMAAGLPVVAASVGGVPELVVDGETGFLIPPADEAALASALERLVADADLRRRMGAAGRARAEALFDLPTFHRLHLGLYGDELAARGLPLPSP
jgi:glycosyltransferase involved in cell wall biosynthesis